MTIIYSEQARKNLKKLDKQIAKRIIKYLEELEKLENPYLKGKALTANLSGLWRYRVGDYRIICEIKNNELIILVIKIEHRKQIYND